MPSKTANVKNEPQYEALKHKGMSKERAAKIANSPGAPSRGGKKSGSGGNAKHGGTTAQKKKLVARVDERPRRSPERKLKRSHYPMQPVREG